ncbi:FMN-binding protein [Kribbella rubisoli]|nr:FMN-binding protein [Kribbella rubisoli]
MTIATTAVVAVAYRTGTQPRTVSEANTSRTTTPTAAPRAPSSEPQSKSPAKTPSATPSATPRQSTRTKPSSSAALTVAGDVVDTQYGPVQVEITMRGGRITTSRALERPSGDGQTDEINSSAIPQLDQEAVAAQSAQVDTVSGATFTSDGYAKSLQSAIDAAHRAGAR